MNGKSLITVTNITSSFANCLQSPVRVLLRGYSFDTAGFEFVYTTVKFASQITTTNLTFLHISDSKFFDDSGGGVNIELHIVHSNVNYKVLLKTVLFKETRAQLEVL